MKVQTVHCDDEQKACALNAARSATLEIFSPTITFDFDRSFFQSQPNSLMILPLLLILRVNLIFGINHFHLRNCLCLILQKNLKKNIISKCSFSISFQVCLFFSSNGLSIEMTSVGYHIFLVWQVTLIDGIGFT